MLVNSRVVRIEWGDCDPAGIVYYPRYFAFFDASTSALLERALGMTKHQYLKAYDFAGHPLVNTHSRFLIPTRFGDDVTIETRGHGRCAARASTCTTACSRTARSRSKASRRGSGCAATRPRER